VSPYDIDSVGGRSDGWADFGPVWRPPPGKRGAFLHKRLVESGGSGLRVRRLGRNRAGEIRITRFLRNPAVSIGEMLQTAGTRTAARMARRHVLAIQDTTTIRAAADGRCIALHPLIAVDAIEGTVLGLIDARFFVREGGKRDHRHERDFIEKESQRWLQGQQHAAALAKSGAVQITVVTDREGDIYEDFALKPREVEVLIRAGQDRALTNQARLFAATNSLPEAGRMAVDLPAAPGRRARTALLALRFCMVEIARPVSRRLSPSELEALPSSIKLTLVEARELDPPPDVPVAHWRLLTTHTVADVADARRMVGYYRQRWTIEQLFRTLKTQGFDVEALRLAEHGPFEKLVAASLIAAVTVLQLVRERDGIAKRPLEDAFDADDLPALEAVSQSLEGKTARQKNPHPRGSLAFAAWVLARLGGWTGYYGKPGPVVMLSGLVQFHAIKHGWRLRNV
jgi:hypothetical protein